VTLYYTEGRLLNAPVNGKVLGREAAQILQKAMTGGDNRGEWMPAPSGDVGRLALGIPSCIAREGASWSPAGYLHEIGVARTRGNPDCVDGAARRSRASNKPISLAWNGSL
jgi:hypothetical protein